MYTLYTVLALALVNIASSTLTPDNTCGGKNGYTCDPKLARGGPCCSTSGYCGSSAAYCGTGCQGAFGTCWSGKSSSVSTTETKIKTKKTKTKTKSAGTFNTVSSSTTSTTSSGVSPTTTPCGHIVPNVGTFTNFANYTFLSSSLPDGLRADAYQVGDLPYTHLFQVSNVVLTPPYLSLIVPGGQNTFPINSAQMSTSVQNILYASVRTTAILSSVPGTCISTFFYKNDNQEIDIEFITNSSAIANDVSTLPSQQKKAYGKWTNVEKAQLPLHYTNQPSKKGGSETFSWGPGAASDAVQEHEYRIDWTEGRVDFFLDGVLQQEFESNVPTMAGSWLWSNWADGNPGWTTGPPLEDSIFKIRSIEMYYNTTDSGSKGGSCM